MDIKQAKIAHIRWNKIHSKIIDKQKGLNESERLKYKARLCGYLAGDGYIKARKDSKIKRIIHYDIQFSLDHSSIVNSCQEAFIALYGISMKIKNNGKYFTLRKKCKPVCLDLLSFGDRFESLNWHIPKLSTREQEIEWLRAFFDSEAYVGASSVCVQSVNRRGLLQVQKLLLNYGIESRLYTYHRKQKNWNTNYLLFILKKESKYNYLKNIGFNHSVKQEKLKNQFEST